MTNKIADGLRSEIEDVPISKEQVDSNSLSLKGEAQEIDPVLEKKVLRKVDLNLVPILFLLFLCAFIDRYVATLGHSSAILQYPFCLLTDTFSSSSINIGNARIQGLEKDLGMTGQDYNIALFTFFVLYILLEVPCNMILKKIRPSVFLSSIMAGWGVVTVCQGLTKSFAGLVVCRVIIGALEGQFQCLVELSISDR